MLNHAPDGGDVNPVSGREAAQGLAVAHILLPDALHFLRRQPGCRMRGSPRLARQSQGSAPSGGDQRRPSASRLRPHQTQKLSSHVCRPQWGQSPIHSFCPVGSSLATWPFKQTVSRVVSTSRRFFNLNAVAHSRSAPDPRETTAAHSPPSDCLLPRLPPPADRGVTEAAARWPGPAHLQRRDRRQSRRS